MTEHHIITDPADRYFELADELLERPQHRHLTDDQDRELWWLLWEAHDGDDRCGCLKLVILAVQLHDELLALELCRNCIAEHPAGQGMRAFDQADQLGGLK